MNFSLEEFKDVLWLTPRELDVLQLMGEGLTMREVSARLNLKKRTVETYLDRVREALHVHSYRKVIVIGCRYNASGLRRARVPKQGPPFCFEKLSQPRIFQKEDVKLPQLKTA